MKTTANTKSVKILNLEEITETLNQLQKRCSANLILPEELPAIIAEIEGRLDEIQIAKCNREGIEIHYSRYKKIYSSYPTPTGTHLNCIRASTGWKVTAARDYCGAQDKKIKFLTVSEGAVTNALEGAFGKNEWRTRSKEDLG